MDKPFLFKYYPILLGKKAFLLELVLQGGKGKSFIFLYVFLTYPCEGIYG
jgi:hypothetical protein